MIITSFSEIISIGAVIPFLGVLTSPNSIYTHPAAQDLISILEINDAKELLLLISVGFVVAAIFAGTMRILLIWANTRLTFATGADLSLNIYRRTLYQPYSVHISRNSSELINGITVKTNAVIHVSMSVLTIISSLFMLITIMTALLIIKPVVAITTFGGFGIIYALIILFTRNKLRIVSHHIAKESTKLIKSLQEGLGGIRDVLIDGNQETYSKIYRSADLTLRAAQGKSIFISQSPRYMMEAMGMVLITIIAYVATNKPEGIENALPILGALALGAQRMLPVMQQAYSAWSEIQSGQVSLKDTLDLLDQPLPSHANSFEIKPIEFNEKIEIKNIEFKYSNKNELVVKNISLTIPKGSRIGFIGSTGSGKSTLIDIIMGLLEPIEGTLEIDGQIVTKEKNRSWQLHIAHVPQTIFLADCTIEENIAFGKQKGEIDFEKVRNVAKQSQIHEAIERLPLKYKTMVGERGVSLSGGQRQRIGIARALYKEADVLIFDEATSALDNETEEAVMNSIEGLSKNLTIICIAHRLTTLKNCDQIVELKDGEVNRIGSYKNLFENKL
jgi:ATP-binding cassette subfamily B protein